MAGLTQYLAVSVNGTCPSCNVPAIPRLRSKVRSCFRSERAWHGNDPGGVRHFLRFELSLEHHAHSIESAVGPHHQCQLHWQASGIYTFTSGSWLTVTDGTDISLTGLGSDRPSVVADWHVDQQTIKRWFNTSAFTRQPAGTFGNAGRATILGPSAWNVDAALWKTFRITESTKMDLRVEAFNVFNHARFNSPGTSLSNGNTLGQITSALDPRIMQLALKLSF